MQELGLAAVFEAIEQAFKDENLNRVEGLLWPALEQFPDISRLWFYGGCVFFKTGRAAVAASLFSKAIDLDDAAHVYSNLGACYRRMNLQEEGRLALKAALDRDPNSCSALVNMGSMYVNEGTPELGIPFLERAVAMNEERGAGWNLGLLYLEAGRFAEGFDWYRKGVSFERQTRKYGSDKHNVREPDLLTPESERAGKTLIVWGEQGIGDELMFGTVLKDAKADFSEVIFECHPRLYDLHRRAHADLRIYPTRKDEYIGWPFQDRIQADYKCPIGDLCALYRRDVDAFAKDWAPTYSADPKEQSEYRAGLETIAAGRPIIGLATRGGVMQTARTYRTLTKDDVDALFSTTNALFVSLDYDDMMPLAEYIEQRHGPDRFKFWPSINHHYGYQHTAALVGACDMVVTVCQSVAHLSAQMGMATRVLVPQRCAWRYAIAGIDSQTWYWAQDPAVKLLRQTDPESWRDPIERACADIRGLQ